MSSLNVMIVDDSAITLKKLNKMLDELGHVVVGSCSTGADAVEAYPDLNPDLVTMDITMPDMNGIEATQKILEKHPDALILMVTSHGQEAMVLDAVQAGAKGYLLKPIKIEALKSNLDRLIERFI